MPGLLFTPDNIRSMCEKNKTILDITLENDIVLNHTCGGTCSCSSCRIIILKGAECLNKKSSEEEEQLKMDGFSEENERLACQCKIINEESDIIIQIPPIEKL